MSSFAPQVALTPHHSEIAENARGHWVAKDKEGLIGGVFRTQKDALPFALFEVAGDCDCVRILPRNSILIRATFSRQDQQRPASRVGEGRAGTVGRSRGRPNSALCGTDVPALFAFAGSLWPRARARLNGTLGDGIVAAQHGWWQTCPELRLPATTRSMTSGVGRG
jgi:hypothetical protein